MNSACHHDRGRDGEWKIVPCPEVATSLCSHFIDQSQSPGCTPRRKTAPRCSRHTLSSGDGKRLLNSADVYTTVCPSAHKTFDSLSSSHEKSSPSLPEGDNWQVPYRPLVKVQHLWVIHNCFITRSVCGFS